MKSLNPSRSPKPCFESLHLVCKASHLAFSKRVLRVPNIVRAALHPKIIRIKRGTTKSERFDVVELQHSSLRASPLGSRINEFALKASSQENKTANLGWNISF